MTLLQKELEISLPILIKLYRTTYKPVGRCQAPTRHFGTINKTTILLDRHIGRVALNVSPLNNHQYDYQTGKPKGLALQNFVEKSTQYAKRKETEVV